MQSVRATSLFYRAEGFGVGALLFDLVTGESHSMSNTISTHKLETGAKISDHIKNDLRPGSISGIVTNYSIQERTTFLPAGAVPGQGTPNRALTAYEAFRKLWKSRTLVTVVTQLEIYENVAISNISVTKDTPEEVLEFYVDFQEVTSAEIKALDIEASVNPLDMTTDLDRQAAVESSQGRQAGL